MNIVVIGNGVAGEAACSAIRSRTRERKITLISEDTHPFYSPCILANYISKEVKRSDLFLKRLSDYEDEGVELLLGHRVERVDPLRKLVILPGREIPYQKLILATGSRPIIPAIEGVRKKGVMVLKSLRDADRIFKAQGVKASIIGSGPIGIELAIALRKRRWEVALIESLDCILPHQLDARAASIVRHLLEHHGIEVLTGANVLSIEGKTAVNGVIVDKTGRRDADMVVLSVGMEPSVDLGREAGVRIGALGGIKTNDEMETNIKDVYACGDCVEGKDPFTLKPRLSLLWPHAERQGTVAGVNAIGEHCFVRWMPDIVNLDVFGTPVSAIGEPAVATGGDGPVTSLESHEEEHYRCLVISEERLVGAQFIGDFEGIGILGPFLGKGYEEICQKTKDERMAPCPWYLPVKHLFT